MRQREISNLLKDLRPKNEVTKSYDFLFNNPTQKPKQKTFFIRKVNDNEDSNKKITEEFEKYFYNPDTYFASNSPIRVGKKPEITDISIEIKSNSNNKRQITKKNNALNISIPSRKKSILTKLSKDKYSNPIFDNTKFELIDNKKLDSIFNEYKTKIDLNNKNNKSETKYNNLPLNISLPLNNQQNNLLQQNYNNRQNKHLINYLSKKLHENKDDLLMNRIDNFLYKKELINKREKNNPLYEINDRYKWASSLRNPDKFKGIRKSLVNINTDKYPFWGFLIEKSPNMRQTSIRPGINVNNRNLKYFINKAKSFEEGINDNKLNNLDEINVKGENLFDIEYNREMSSKKRKILHKVFVVNGKALFNTEINNTFGKETFYKNYERNKIFFSPINYNKNRNKNIIITLSN